jgi:hypothetical protein
VLGHQSLQIVLGLRSIVSWPVRSQELLVTKQSQAVHVHPMFYVLVKENVLESDSVLVHNIFEIKTVSIL